MLLGNHRMYHISNFSRFRMQQSTRYIKDVARKNEVIEDNVLE